MSMKNRKLLIQIQARRAEFHDDVDDPDDFGGSE